MRCFDIIFILNSRAANHLKILPEKPENIFSCTALLIKYAMRKIISSLILSVAFLSIYSQSPTPQVNIEARFMEVNDNFMKELGINFQLGLNLAHQTNTSKDDRVPKPGVNIGVAVEAEPLGGLFVAPGISFFQNGNKYRGDDFTDATTRNNLELKLLVNPRIIVSDGPVSVGIVVEPAISYTLGEVNKTKINGEKDKTKVDFGDNDHRVEGIIRTGVSGTLRTDIGDLTISALYSFGLTNIHKGADPPIKNQVFSLNVIGKLFTNRENAKNRKELLIFITPKIIDSEDP